MTLNGFSQSMDSGNSSRYNLVSAYLGISGFNGGYNVKTPSFGVAYEVKPGRTFSFGAYLGYTAMEYEGSTFFEGVDKNISGLDVGLIANTHFLQQDDMQIYLGLIAGYQTHSSLSGFLFEPHLGIRKYITEKIAINGELGLGLALLRIGASFKL